LENVKVETPQLKGFNKNVSPCLTFQ
jgi:hypothetical protein